MGQDDSTLQPSELSPDKGDSGAATPGLLRVFAEGAAMATALPLEREAIHLGREFSLPNEAPDRRMSRRHARITFDGRRFLVTDLGSQNGTFVDGKPLTADTPQEVQRVIRAGDSLFVPCADVGPFRSQGVTVHDGFVRGPAMRLRLAEALRAAELGLSLCVHGESGTGKEGVARAYHEGGPQREGPFVAINCATLPPQLAEAQLFGAKRGAYSGAVADTDGYFVAAHDGTLFLDEVGDLDLQVQAKLLRALESREIMALGATKPRAVNVHFCSASHKDLRAEVARGRMREDLYFRIGQPEIKLPPLRQRPEEIAFLVEREVRRVGPDLGAHISLIEACLLRPWPGNVRELLGGVRGATQSALMQASRRVESWHLPAVGLPFAQLPASSPPPSRKPAPVVKPLDAGLRKSIEDALREHGGNVRAVARELGIHRTQLRRLIERHHIAIPTGDRGQ